MADRTAVDYNLQHMKPRADFVDYLLFDVFELKSGPQARLPLRHPVHPDFTSL